MTGVMQALRAAMTSKSLEPVNSGRGWVPLIRESFAGAWQKNVTIDRNAAQAHHAVFACTTLIASDIAKLRLRLVRDIGNDIWQPYRHTYLSPLLRKPNGYQNRVQFVENWILSKLQRGNTYVLKVRNGRGDVTALHVLNPDLVTPLVSDSGEVFYDLSCDNLSGIGSQVIVPARQIIHDRANCLFHPLVGIPPIYACGLAATHGLAIQNSQAALFRNSAQPGGILTAPGKISDENAKRLKDYWDGNFKGDLSGQVAVLGDGLKFEKLSLTAEETQLIEQLKMTAEIVCSAFHVPPHMVGMGPVPAMNSVEALGIHYFSQALQMPIEAMEACLDEGLGLADDHGVEFDVDGLLRMDTGARAKSLTDLVGGSIMAPNEARAKLDLPPVDGGESPMAQQQDFSLAALAERDRGKPFATPSPSATP